MLVYDYPLIIHFISEGDSGYPLEPFLITPYRNAAENSPEARFNYVHSQARSIVERCIGVMKSIFSVSSSIIPKVNEF